MGMDSIIDAVAGKVRFPKEITINNRRLGVVFRVLQVVMAIYIIFTVFLAQAWIDESIPSMQYVTFWPEKRANYNDAPTDVPHCGDMTPFTYTFSSTFVYTPGGCQPIPSSESFMKKSENVIFFPTYIEDTFTDTDSDTKTASASFFARNAEEYTIVFYHRYSARDTSNRFDGGVVNQQEYQPLGTCNGADAKKVDPVLVEGQAGELLSVIKKSDCSMCSVGGKSQWSKTDASSGIAGSLKEWLTCAGVDLDSSAGLPPSGADGEEGSASFRLAGMELLLKLVYKNQRRHSEEYNGEKFKGLVAEIRPEVVPKWNSQPVVGYALVPDYVTFTGGSFSGGHSRYRYQYGITVKIITDGGSFAFFNLQKFQTAIVTALVFLSIPLAIVKTIALFLIGPISEIYSTLANQPVSLMDETYSTLMRLATYMNTFDMIARDDGDSKSISVAELSATFQKALGHVEGLEPKEIDDLALVVMQGLDADGSQRVKLAEFIDCVMHTEPVKPKQLGKLFDAERKRNPFEIIFTDSVMAKKLKPNISEADRSSLRQASEKGKDKE